MRKQHYIDEEAELGDAADPASVDTEEDRDLRVAIKQIRRGECVPWEEVKRQIREALDDKFGKDNSTGSEQDTEEDVAGTFGKLTPSPSYLEAENLGAESSSRKNV